MSDDSTAVQTLGPDDRGFLAEFLPVLPRLFVEAGERASYRLIDFLCATIRNRNTREAYARAITRFCRFCESKHFLLQRVNSLLIASYIEQCCPDVDIDAASRTPLSAPSVKQHLAAIKMLFDHLVTGHIVPVNPAAAVRGPRHVVTKGKTPVLAGPDAQRLLDSIESDTIVGRRDRAIIATMIYSFARISALVGTHAGDYRKAADGRTTVLRFKEKNGKDHELPLHRHAQALLHAYLVGTGILIRKDAPLFRTVDRRGDLTDRRLSRTDAWAMVKRRCRKIGLSPSICCHTFRATGITQFLLSGGSLENAQLIAAHSSPRTTKLYDRRSDQVTLREIERIDLNIAT
jgi:integrase/recombinase XerD